MTDPTTDAILARLRTLGYIVSEGYGQGRLRLTARTVPPGPADVVAEVEGDDGGAYYRAACLLARGCGIDLEDG